MTNIQELIERLEKATGPDRALDREIAESLGITVLEKGGVLWAERGQSFRPLHHYSFSIDAALTLVPEGWTWQVRLEKRPVFVGPDRARVVLMADPSTPNGDQFVKGATPALAICIAALKARLALDAVLGEKRHEQHNHRPGISRVAAAEGREPS